MPVLVKNTKLGPTVFTDKLNDLVVEWQGRGNRDGEDVQQVPDSMLQNMNFMRAIRSGILSVVNVEGDEAEALLARQGVAYQERVEEEARRANSALDTYSEQTIATARIADDSAADADPENREIRRNVGQVVSIIEEGTGLDEAGEPAHLTGRDEVVKPIKVTIGYDPLPDQNR